MCGIAGYITNKKTNYRHAVAVAVMAKHMEERGGHSWGAMDSNRVIRGLGSINLGLQLTSHMPQQMALHTRYATTGARVVENSHPFTLSGPCGEVVGMHNGIISNHAVLNRDQKRALVVDSQHIFANIAEGRGLNNLEGYGAIVYRLNGEWFIGRFNDGDMRAVITSHGVFFASTKDAIMEALSYAGVEIQQWLKVRDNNVYRLTHEGLNKAYKVDAMGTRFKWDDAITQYYQLQRPATARPVTPQATAATSERAPQHAIDSAAANDLERDYENPQCDYCGAYDCPLYVYDRKDAICGDCYYEIANEVPAGFDADSY